MWFLVILAPLSLFPVSHLSFLPRSLPSTPLPPPPVFLSCCPSLPSALFVSLPHTPLLLLLINRRSILQCKKKKNHNPVSSVSTRRSLTYASSSLGTGKLSCLLSSFGKRPTKWISLSDQWEQKRKEKRIQICLRMGVRAALPVGLKRDQSGTDNWEGARGWISSLLNKTSSSFHEQRATSAWPAVSNKHPQLE